MESQISDANADQIEETDSTTATAGDVNIPLSKQDRTTRQRIGKGQRTGRTPQTKGT